MQVPWLERRLAALRDAGLDHIQLSFQASSQELNDYLSRTRTFDLKRRLAAQIKAYQFPMVMNCVVHRLNIDQVEQIINLAPAAPRRASAHPVRGPGLLRDAPQALHERLGHDLSVYQSRGHRLTMPGSADTPGD